MNGTDILKHFVSGLSASLGTQTFDDVEDNIYHTLSLISSDTRIEATITHFVGKDGVVHQRISGVEMFRRNWKRLDLISASPHMYYHPVVLVAQLASSAFILMHVDAGTMTGTSRLS